MAGNVKIIFSAEVNAALAAIQGFVRRVEGDLNQLGSSIQTGLGIDIGRRLLDGLAGIPRTIEASVKQGVAFNSTLEDARIGIAAVLRQFDPQAFKTFNDALATSDKALGALQKKALESPATFQQLVGTFQALTGPATGAGIALEKQVDLVVLMSQALAGLGIRSEQLIQESRALITGNINQDAAAAKILGITASDITAAKEAGQLYEFLAGRLSAFSEAGKLSAQTLTVAQSNLKDAVEQTFAAVSRPIFDTLKAGFLSLTADVTKPEFKQGLQDIAANINRIVQAGFALASFGARHVTELATAFQVLAVAVAGAAVGMTAFKAASLLNLTSTLGLIPAIGSFKDLRAVIALAGTTAVSSALSAGVAVAGLATIVYGLIEFYRMLNAEAKEQAAIEGLKKSNTLGRERAQKEIELQLAAGEITAEKAEALKKRLEVAFAPPVVKGTSGGRGGTQQLATLRDPDRESDAVRAVTLELAGIKPAAQADAEAKQTALSKAGAEERAKIELASLDYEEALLEASLARKEISLEQFQARQLEFIKERAVLEASAGEKTPAEQSQIGYKAAQAALALEERIRTERTSAAKKEEDEQRTRDDNSKTALGDLKRKWEESILSRQQLLTAQHSREMQELAEKVSSYEDFIQGYELLTARQTKERADLNAEQADRQSALGDRRSGLEIRQADGGADSDVARALTVNPLLEARNAILRDRIELESRITQAAGASAEAEQAAQEKILGYQEEMFNNEEEIEARKKRMRDAIIEGTNSMFKDIASAAKAFGKEGLVVYKAFAIASVMVDTAKAAMGSFSALADIPYVGPYLGAVAAAAAVAAGAAQIANINAASAGYEKGGLVQGGEQTIRINERGPEFVVNAEATARNRSLLEAMNSGRMDVARMAAPFTSSSSQIQSEAPGLQRGGSAAAPQVNVSAPPSQIFVVDSREMADQLINSGRLKDYIITTFNDAKPQMGFQT